MTTPAAGEIMSVRPPDQREVLTFKMWQNCGFLPHFVLRCSIYLNFFNKINE
jgi:hypothetical protein